MSEMSQPLFSVVIPCYNYAHTVGRAIESVLAQDGDDFEIIVVNDGSTDDSEPVIKYYSSRHPNLVRYEYQDNGGLAATRNRGIQLSKGRYLIFLDADDEMVDGALSRVRDHLDEEGDVDLLIGGHISASDKCDEKIHHVKPLPHEPEQRFLAYLNRKISISNGATLMHRRIFNAIKYCEDLRNVEDIPVFAQVLALYDCRVIDTPIAKICKHSDSLRYDTNIARDVGLRVVDVLFDKKILPSELFKYRRMYYAKRCLSLFRIFYLGGEREAARHYYCTALKTDPRALLKWSYFKKYIRFVFRSYFSH